MNAGKTASSEKSSVEVQSKHSVGNTCMTSFNTIEFSIPPKRFRFGLSDDEESHSYLQVKLLIQGFWTRILNTLMGTLIFPKNTKNLVLFFQSG